MNRVLLMVVWTVPLAHATSFFAGTLKRELLQRRRYPAGPSIVLLSHASAMR
jgi:hypothetical protein